MTTNTEALDIAGEEEEEEEDQFWETDEDGDRCPFCGSFSPAFTGGCVHYVATIGSCRFITDECTRLQRLDDLHIIVIELINDPSRNKDFERFMKHFTKQSKLAKILIRAAIREERLEDMLVDAFGYQYGDGWDTDGLLSGSSANIYHPRLKDSDASEDEAVRLYEVFIQGATEVALIKQASQSPATPI